MKKYKHVTDGRADSPKSLDELMGISTKAVGEASQEEFEQSLKKMPLLEMQAQAIKLGVKPIGDRTRLMKILKERHKKLEKSYNGAYQVRHDIKEKSAKKAQQFLNQFK